MKKKILSLILVIVLFTAVSCTKNNSNLEETTETNVNTTMETNNINKYVDTSGKHPKAEDIELVLASEFENGLGKVDISNNSDYNITKLAMDLSNNKGSLITINCNNLDKGTTLKSIEVEASEEIDFSEFRPIFYELEFENEKGEKEISKYDYDLKEYY
ncbi:hypothetical protein [Miniphocaeibacter halophilus]|uniref:Uncharacterized protein n=1 Tax=Miniphocaeibacter halophilus TaxID=2931922 RepID=A0AC61MQI5_9FIRM|nr:hypothetical protein [Miniphocaeibacter halophilus]QQK07855.1 hypothetical protein JFY71_11355 [Miniphocaeibacter halophilus]